MTKLLPLVAAGCPPLPGDAPEPRAVARQLLGWFTENRRAFTWRTNTNPFYVLFAEILLRKTGARTVEQHLPRLLTVFPDVYALAGAGNPDVVDALSPLGLSRQRATQLQELAQALIVRFDGQVPHQVEALASLPGVGGYTAGIVASTCFGAHVPAVDTNIARLLCRIFDLIPSHMEARKSTNVWRLAALLTQCEKKAGASLTWAELDLAATVCTARKPDHARCPLQTTCLFVKRGATAGPPGVLQQAGG